MSLSKLEVESLIPKLPDGTTIIGIDSSYTATGLCAISNKGVVFDCIQPRKTQNCGRLLEMEQEYTKFLMEHKPTAIFMEGYAYNSRFSRELCGEAGGLFKLTTYRFQLPLYTVAPKVVKSFLTGDDKATKEKMIIANSYNSLVAHRALDVRKACADAYGVAICGLSILTDKNSKLKYQQLI